MKKLLLFVLLLVLGNISYSQVLLEENFNYTVGTELLANGWNITGASVTNPILVVTPGLTFAGYPLSGIGNAAGLMNTGEDVNKGFINGDSATSGALYAAAMVKVTAAGSGDYFMHFGIATDNSIIYMARVFVKLAANGNLSFGISKSSVNATTLAKYTDSVYTLNTTYLLVFKYSFGPGATDDSASLFVNPNIAGTEPAPNVSQGLSAANDPSALRTVNLRQGGGSASAPTLVVDGIKVTRSWALIVPVELTSFTASVVNNSIHLNWTTATEINNRGFEIERRTSSSDWTSVGFISGKGTTTETQNYSFIDNAINGKYQYRLKQVDFNGKFEYSKAVEVDFFNNNYSLDQNYPNPFNPSTEISFNVAKSGNVSLKVYNLIGQEVKTLINGMVEAGAHKIKFNAAGLNSGLYFYKLETENFSQVKKMTLIK